MNFIFLGLFVTFQGRIYAYSNICENNNLLWTSSFPLILLSSIELWLVELRSKYVSALIAKVWLKNYFVNFLHVIAYHFLPNGDFKNIMYDSVITKTKKLQTSDNMNDKILTSSKISHHVKKSRLKRVNQKLKASLISLFLVIHF